VWLIDIVFFRLSFLPGCSMLCRFIHTLSVTHYLFILCLIGDVAWLCLEFIARAICSNVWTVSVLCSSCLESAEPLRKLTSSVRIKLGGYTY
jgi:hypothetical protein